MAGAAGQVGTGFCDRVFWRPLEPSAGGHRPARADAALETADGNPVEGAAEAGHAGDRPADAAAPAPCRRTVRRTGSAAEPRGCRDASRARGAGTHAVPV